MSHVFDVSKALRENVSEVALEELARRGHSKVKVLNGNAVQKLVDEAVARVLSDRLEQATNQERQQLHQEARSEFERLVKERKDREIDQQRQFMTRVRELEAENASLRDQLSGDEAQKATTNGLDPDQIGAMIRDAIEGARPSEKLNSPAVEQLEALKSSIENLADRVTRGVSGGNNQRNRVVEPPSEEALVAFFSQKDGEEIESNIKEVKVKKAKATGIEKNLAKLRALQNETE
ncbi:MAG TPA: hypothetical protein EYN79_10420 [Planctomycetes bacterium]|nr:hypothetical protein [Planctomycetota bacterium]HIN80443.1 hypothetical protein [Planctomycetota bacterium]